MNTGNMRALEPSADSFLVSRQKRAQGVLRHYVAPTFQFQQFPYFDERYVPHTEGFLNWAKRACVAILKFLFLAFISALSYGIFYRLVMPRQYANKDLAFVHIPETITKPLHSPSPTQQQVSLFQTRNEKSISDRDAQVKPTMIPTASVDLLAKHNHWQAFQPVLPTPLLKDRLLRAGQEYFIEVSLTLPESKTNIRSEIFGVVTELYYSGDAVSSHDEGMMEYPSCILKKKNSTLLAKAELSYRFPHQSQWIGTVRSFLLLLPILLGAVQEVRTVSAPVFRYYVEHGDFPLQHLIVKILDPRPSGRVEVTGGRITIGEEYSNFQELLRTWFYSCYCVGTMIIASLLYSWLFFAKMMWLGVEQRYLNEMEEPECDLNMDTSSYDDAWFEHDDEIVEEELDEADFFETKDDQVDSSVDRSRNSGGRQPGEVNYIFKRDGQASPVHVVVDADDEDCWEDLDPPSVECTIDVLTSFPSHSALVSSPPQTEKQQGVPRLNELEEISSRSIDPLRKDIDSIDDNIDCVESENRKTTRRVPSMGNNDSRTTEKHPFLLLFGL